ncbi:MAG TPA: DUF6279 family lipoprotein [Methylophilaceae bacterium]
MPILIRKAVLFMLLLTLGGCSSVVRIGYNHAQELAYYWLDSHVGFTAEQKSVIQAELAALHEWHRTNEIPLYLRILRDAREKVLHDTNGKEVCSLVEDVRERMRTFNLQVEPIVEKLAPTLSHEQLARMERRFERDNREWRKDWLEGSQEERDRRRLKLAVKRAERYYGSLTAAQRDILEENQRISIFNADTSYEERLRSQSDAVATLRKIIDLRLTPADIKIEVAAYFDRLHNGDDLAYQNYIDRLTIDLCDGIARLHNSTSPQQRQHAAARIDRHIRDLEALRRETRVSYTP